VLAAKALAQNGWGPRGSLRVAPRPRLE